MKTLTIILTCALWSVGAASGADAPCKSHYILNLPDQCLSSPGAIDGGFGDGGLVLRKDFRVNGIALQPDGKIIIVGSETGSGAGSRPTDAPHPFALIRMTRDGALDASIGVGGKIATLPGPEGGAASSVAVQPDGRIVAGGYLWLHRDLDFFQGTTALALARYLPDGQLDPSFGSDGMVSTTIGVSSDLNRLVLQPDGKIVAQGQTCDSGRIGCMLALVRYNGDGSLDASFGNGGIVLFPHQNRGNLVLQPDGKLITSFYYKTDVAPVQTTCATKRMGDIACTCTSVSGSTYTCYPTIQDQARFWASGLLRFNPNGTLDRAFGIDGVVATPFEATALTVGADSRIVIAGASLTASPDHPWLTVARYAADGSLDPSFGTEGIAAYALPGGLDVQAWFGDFVSGIQQQLDGKLVVVASRGDVLAWSSILVARYATDGQLDRTFSNQGYVHTVKTGLDFASDFALQPDGKILVAADVWLQGNGLIRYRGDEVVEFYNRNSGHYFVTVDPAEQASVATGGAGPGWSLTGESFKSNGQKHACRFYGAPTVGPDSHFFTLDSLECELARQDPGWRFEGYDFAAVPKVAGGCPEATVPVYRTYNNGFVRNDSNHRYMTSEETYNQMIGENWTGEGVVFCVPP